MFGMLKVRLLKRKCSWMRELRILVLPVVKGFGATGRYTSQNGASLLSTIWELWQACRQVAQEKLLTWPDFPIEYVPQPSWARKAAPYLYFCFTDRQQDFSVGRAHVPGSSN